MAVSPNAAGKWTNYPTTFYDPKYPITGAKQFFSGEAGFYSTAEDSAKFLQMYLNNGKLNGIRLLSRTTIKGIMANQTGTLFPDNSKSFYGLAFLVTTKKGAVAVGNRSLRSFCCSGYFNTSYFADLEEKIIGILLKQTQNIKKDDTRWKFPVLVGQRIDDWP